jgi:glycosyltransferase involved in cell wall biosynthesis
VTVFSLVSSEGQYGVENLLVSLAHGLSELGCKVVVGVFRDSRLPHLEVAEEAQRRGLSVEIIPCQGRCDWSAVERMRKLVQEHKVDVINPHGYKADFYAYMAARRMNVALVATSHNWPSQRFSMRLYAAFDQFLLSRFDRVVAVSDVPASILRRRGVLAERLVSIPNGVDVNRLEGASPTLRNELPPTGPMVGFVGRFVPDKGGALLLQAAKGVLAAHGQARFVMVGDGPSRRDWETMAIQLGIADKVIFTGVRQDMPGVYASFDMLVLPSLVESMPMCLLEAMAAGRPIIATRVGAIPSMLTDQHTGVLINPGNIRELSGAIASLLSNPILARHLGKNAQAHVARDFSAETMVRNYIDVFGQAIASRGTRTHSGAAWEASC